MPLMGRTEAEHSENANKVLNQIDEFFSEISSTDKTFHTDPSETDKSDSVTNVSNVSNVSDTPTEVSVSEPFRKKEISQKKESETEECIVIRSSIPVNDSESTIISVRKPEVNTLQTRKFSPSPEIQSNLYTREHTETSDISTGSTKRYLEEYGDSFPTEVNLKPSKPAKKIYKKESIVNDYSTDAILRELDKIKLESEKILVSERKKIKKLIKKTEQEYIDDVSEITKDFSQKLVTDVKDNINNAQGYILENQEEILIEIIKYLIIIINFANKGIIVFLNFFIDKVFGNENSVFKNFYKYIESLMEILVKRVSDKTTEKILITEFWNKYSTETKKKNKSKLLNDFFTKHGKTVPDKEISSLDELLALFKI